MNSDEIIKNCDLKMKKAFSVFNQDLASLRTGRANVSMLDIIKVEVYGQNMSINQLATISTPDARSLNVQVWDLNNVTLIDSAIKKSDLGINPQIDGQLLRIPIPSLNEERRSELKKIMGNLAEKSKIAIRNIRRDANASLKKNLKIMNKSENLIEFVEDRPGHDLRYSLDSTKIHDQLGWKVKTTFDDGLKKTVQWYLDNPELLNNISSTVLDPTPWKSSN